MNQVKPISPKEVKSVGKTIHPDIIEIVNEMIKQRFDGERAVLLQKDIIDFFMMRNPQFNRQRLYDEKHLDIEELYSQQGWKVVYDKPGFNETHYEPNFTFTVAK